VVPASGGKRMASRERKRSGPSHIVIDCWGVSCVNKKGKENRTFVGRRREDVDCQVMVELRMTKTCGAVRL
jgi:hypothetical protein